MLCAVCSTEMRADVLGHTFRCASCGFFSSEFPVRINQAEQLDETARERALKTIRSANFEQLLVQTWELFPTDGTLLDVGCAHGWFLNAVKARTYHGIGIEPDRKMAEIARSAGHDVNIGFFPDALASEARYDVITFNDVFEHLPDVNRMAEAVHRHLEASGILIINLPVSDGLIFSLSRSAARVGVCGPLARMWQRGMPSPHLSYFSVATLPALLHRHGFRLEKSGPLEALSNHGLYDRIRYVRDMSAPAALASYAAARAISVVAGYFPSDIHYFAFRRLTAG